MQRKNFIGFILTFVILFSVCINSFEVYAQEEIGRNFFFENNVTNVKDVKDEDVEEPEKVKDDALIEKLVEDDKKSEKIDRAQDRVNEKVESKDLKTKNSEDDIDLGEERIPQAVGVPAGFDLKSIHTIAKTLENGQVKYYGVRTYSNGYDTPTSKVFYQITEDQYNQVANDCFMIFKRQDGNPFEMPRAKVGTNQITDSAPIGGSLLGPVITEIQLRHHMAYREGLILNSDPTREPDSQKDLTWSIELKKDWVIEGSPDFGSDGSPDYAYVFYNVVIDGRGHKIYRKDDESKGIFLLGSGLSGNTDIPVKTATIKDLTIEGSGKYFGIDVSPKGVLNLQNVTIKNCLADPNHSSYGGAIRLNSDSSLNIDNSTFTNCTAEAGGAIRLSSGNNKLNIKNSTFFNNVGRIGGAICSFKHSDRINIEDSVFENNEVKDIGSGYRQNGGAIYSNSKLNIVNSKFNKNIALRNGGAIACADEVEIKNSKFNENEAGNYGGGAIYVAKKLSVKDSTFSKNRSKQFGGAILAFGDTNIEKNSFNENISNSSGGAIYQTDSARLNIKDSNFIKNGCPNQGGAVFVDNEVQSNFENIKFESNKSNNGGGAIYIEHSNENEVKLLECNFIGNGSKFGGGLYVNVKSKAKVDECNFRKNIAFNGGGISTGTYEAWIDDSCNLTINKSTFEENAALLGGGVFTAFPTEIKDSSFTKNEAQVHENDDKGNPHLSGSGGAVHVIFKQTDIEGCKFIENNAYGSGGALSINGVYRAENNKKIITGLKEGVKVNIKGGTVFENNYCLVGQGGAIHTIPYSYDLEDQTAQDEKAFKAAAYKNLTTANDTVFKGNWAMSGFFNPPTNYEDYTDLKYKSNSFTEKYKDNILAKSLLNNFDVNFKNEKVTAYFDPNGGEFPNEANPKDIKVIKKDKVKEEGKYKGADITILQAPKRDGYKFLGWKATRYISEEEFKSIKQIVENFKESEEAKEKAREVLSQGKIFNPGDKLTLYANITFIAQWEEKPEPKPEPKPEAKPEPKPEVKIKEHEYVETSPVIVKLPEKETHIHKRYLFGYPDKRIMPEGNMTRAEAVAVVTRLEAYDFDDNSAKIFSDMKKGAWYNKYINVAYKKGILVEKEGESFRPDEPITRAELAKLISFIDEKNSSKAPFPDIKGHIYEEAINQAYGNKRILGYPDGSFRPDAKITRAEIVTMLNSLYGRKADDKSLENVKNLELLKVFKDLNKEHWAYYEIIEAANSHEYVRRDKGIVEDWIRIIDDIIK